MPELLGITRRVASTDPAQPERGATRISGLSTYRIETWGCQMNDHDSEKMAGILRSFGLSDAASEQDADIILLNTCSIREKAAHKVFTRLGQLRSLKAERPHMILGVCGCVAQQEQEQIFARAPYVDIVMGPRRIGSLPELIEESRIRRHALAVFDPRDALVPELDLVHRLSRTRAWVTVMEGCNKTCTYCIVPFTRGREVCRTPEAILAEVRSCVEQGLVEIELLGQNVNAWRHEAWDFARLLGEVAEVPGVLRTRFTTSHPLHFRDPIIESMASHASVCRHLHLPVQSGSDAILERMRRGYTVDDYRARVDRLRRRMRDISLSTDIIVGFPGETEKDFQQTLDLVGEMRFETVFSFIYSPRPHTPAADYEDDVQLDEKKDRLRRLQTLQDSIRMEIVRELEGTTVEVLVDGPASRGEGRIGGRTGQNYLVNFHGDPSLVGQLVRVRIDRAGPHSLAGCLESGLTSHAARNIDRDVHSTEIRSSQSAQH